jgi:hypothetical protein
MFQTKHKLFDIHKQVTKRYIQFVSYEVLLMKILFSGFGKRQNKTKFLNPDSDPSLEGLAGFYLRM